MPVNLTTPSKSNNHRDDRDSRNHARTSNTHSHTGESRSEHSSSQKRGLDEDIEENDRKRQQSAKERAAKTLYGRDKVKEVETQTAAKTDVTPEVDISRIPDQTMNNPAADFTAGEEFANGSFVFPKNVTGWPKSPSRDDDRVAPGSSETDVGARAQTSVPGMGFPNILMIQEGSWEFVSDEDYGYKPWTPDQILRPAATIFSEDMHKKMIDFKWSFKTRNSQRLVRRMAFPPPMHQEKPGNPVNKKGELGTVIHEILEQGLHPVAVDLEIHTNKVTHDKMIDAGLIKTAITGFFVLMHEEIPAGGVVRDSVVLKRRYQQPQHVISRHEVPIAVYTKEGVGYDYIMFHKKVGGHLQPVEHFSRKAIKEALSTFQPLKQPDEELRVDQWVANEWYNYLTGGKKEAKVIFT